MTNFKTLLFSGLTLIAMQFGGLQGGLCLEDLCCGGNWNYGLEMETGYRADKIEETIGIYDTALILPTTSFGVQYKHLSGILLGGRGFVQNNNWVLKGMGHYGWLTSGRVDIDRYVDGKHVIGHTWDALGGLGYAFCVGDCFEFIPYVGYSYDHQTIEGKNFYIVEPTTIANDFAERNFKANWFGPWVGFDVLYNTTMWCWDVFFNVGYEFHYGKAHSEVNQDLLSGGTLAYHSKNKNVMGNVFRFDVQTNICDGWFVGLNQTYSYWENSHRDHTTFTSGAVLTPTQNAYANRFNWVAYSVALSFGKIF